MEEYHVLAYLSRIGSSFSSFRNIVFYTTESLKLFQIRKKNILSHLQMQSFAGRGTKCFFSFNIIWQPYNRWVTSVQLQYMHMFSHVMSDTGFFFTNCPWNISWYFYLSSQYLSFFYSDFYIRVHGLWKMAKKLISLWQNSPFLV